jgi:hypothetical protein
VVVVFPPRRPRRPPESSFAEGLIGG